MASLNAPIPLFIGATLLGLVGSPTRLISPVGMGTDPNPVLAQETLAQTELGTAPDYRGAPPPPGGEPLPPERLRREVEPLPTDFRVPALQPDYTGDLWVGTYSGLARVEPNTGRLKARVDLPNYTIDALAQDRVGRIWLGTYEGLLRVDPRSNEVTAQNFTLPSNRVLSLQVDRRGYLWVGSDRGLAMISPDKDY